MSLAIVGGEVIDRNGRRRADVVIEGGRVLEVAEGARGDRQLDASGCVVAPALVDLHTHLRQPGSEDAETIETGSRSAVLGGYGAIVAMPNTDPTMDCAEVVRDVMAWGDEALCDVIPTAAISLGRAGESLSPMSELAALGVRIFTDDGSGVQDPDLMRKAMEYSTGLDAVSNGEPIRLAQHCEVDALSEGTFMNEGEWSGRLGIPGQPAEAEELMVMRDIALARLTGARVHFQHLSTEGSVALVRAAKAGGLAVTAEATPHHFTLTDELCASFDAVFKVHPPLRSARDVEAVREGLRDGTIDAIATDHAPHTADRKDEPFDTAPPGMLGLETALPLAMAELGLDLEKVLALMSWRPAEIAGVSDRHGGLIEPGSAANLTVIDPDHPWIVSGAEMASLSANTPFEGHEMTVRVRHTLVSGEVVVEDGKATR